MKFKIGDLVQVKSGGPMMTIDEVFGNNKVRCTWFAGKKREVAIFHEGTLVSKDEPTPATDES